MTALQILIIGLFACIVGSVIAYICAFIQYAKQRKGADKKVSGILLLVVGTILAYFPLKFIAGLFALKIGMIVLVGIDAIMLYRFLKA